MARHEDALFLGSCHGQEALRVSHTVSELGPGSSVRSSLVWGWTMCCQVCRNTRYKARDTLLTVK